MLVSVISEVVTDQRVLKECRTLYNMGYEVFLIGRKSENNFLLKELPYKVIRLNTIYKKGILMYAGFNFQLFFHLLFRRSDILWSNDLDTLMPNYLVSKIKSKQLIYDSHEYFTESVYKPVSKKIWTVIEKFIFPKLKNVITVNHSIKEKYEEQYHVPITVIRNVPYKLLIDDDSIKVELPADKKILVMQGIGLNENRGGEEAVQMMQYLPDDFILYFIGRGTMLNKLKQMVDDLHLQEKVTFIGVLPYDQMMQYTRKCFLGLILEKIEVTDEHMFALPNRLFDYMKAGIPVLSTKAVEIKKIIQQYNAGALLEDAHPQKIAEKIIEVSNDIPTYQLWKNNTAAVIHDNCWENESLKLIDFMEKIK